MESIKDLITAQLLEFLENRGLLDMFSDNYYSSSLGFRFSDNKKCAHISSAFNWDLTPQGKTFWQKVTAAYEDYIVRKKVVEAFNKDN